MNEHEHALPIKSTIDWQNTLEAQARSGLSIRAYCREHNLRESAFHYHKRRLLASRAPEGGFVQIQGGRPGIRLRHLDGSWCVEVDRGFDPGLLREVLEALGR